MNTDFTTIQIDIAEADVAVLTIAAAKAGLSFEDFVREALEGTPKKPAGKQL